MTAEERLIAALKAQNKIVFGNTIGVNAGGDCTVVSEDGTVSAIAGTSISAGSCVAIQTDDGQWYAVSARESGVVQKQTLYKRRNKPPESGGSGGPVKILYLKDGVFYIGGDRPTPIEVYTIPEGYNLFGPASIDNTGPLLDDWLINLRLKKEGKLTFVTVSTSTESRIEDFDIPKKHGGFGGEDPDYPDGDEGFSPDAFGLPYFRCFQNGFYTALGVAVKRRNNGRFSFLEAAKASYVSYWANTQDNSKGDLIYSDILSVGVKSASFTVRNFRPNAGDSINVKLTAIVNNEDGTTTPTEYNCPYIVQLSDLFEPYVVQGVVSSIEGVLPDTFRVYSDTSSSPSTVLIRGLFTGEDFLLEVTKSSSLAVGEKIFLADTENTSDGTVLNLSITALKEPVGDNISETRSYSYTFVSGDTALSAATKLALAYTESEDAFRDVTVQAVPIVFQEKDCALLIVSADRDNLDLIAIFDCSVSGDGFLESDPRIILGDISEVSAGIKGTSTEIETRYTNTDSTQVDVILTFNESEDSFFVGTDLEYMIAVGVRQESYLFAKKSNSQYIALSIVGGDIREFNRNKFKNALDSENNLLDIYTKYYRPNLVDQLLFSIPFKFFTQEDDPEKPIETLDVFVTDLSGDTPKTRKEVISITQPDTSYVAIDASAYIV